MKLRFIVLAMLMTTLFLGCGKEIVVKGLSEVEASKYSFVLQANTNIVCGGITVSKGTIFRPNSLDGQKFLSRETSRFVDFPKESIYLELWNDGNNASGKNLGQGFLVYPNGQFVFDNYKILMMTSDGGKQPDGFMASSIPNQLVVAECIHDGKIVFNPILKEVTK